jgi:hypothetical protein
VEIENRGGEKGEWGERGGEDGGGKKEKERV